MPVIDLTAESSSLPEGLRVLMQDVIFDIIDALWTDLFMTIISTMGIGVLCIVLSFINLRDTLGVLNAKIRQIFSFVPENPTWTVGSIVLIVIFIPALFNLIFSGASPVQASEFACNGHVALCDRPVNEVVFAATHNWW